MGVIGKGRGLAEGQGLQVVVGVSKIGKKWCYLAEGLGLQIVRSWLGCE